MSNTQTKSLTNKKILLVILIAVFAVVVAVMIIFINSQRNQTPGSQVPGQIQNDNQPASSKPSQQQEVSGAETPPNAPKPPAVLIPSPRI